MISTLEAYFQGKRELFKGLDIEKLEKEYNKMPRDLILVLYCERGGRSLLAAKELYDRGYVVKALMGGIRGYYGNRLERE